MNHELLFIFGPSASGKTTLGRSLLAQQYAGKAFIDEATQPESAAVKLQRELRPVFENPKVDPSSIAAAVARFRALLPPGVVGGIIEFESDLYPSLSALQSLEGYQVRSLLLYAPRAHCLRAFLLRERVSGRKLPQRHWELFNPRPEHFARTEFSAWRVESSQDAQWRPVWQIVAELNAGPLAGDGAAPLHEGIVPISSAA